MAQFTGLSAVLLNCSLVHETLYALSHIGDTIPPQADCGWLGEIGPGPSYGEEVDDPDAD